MTNKLIKILIVLENVFCVFRNFLHTKINRIVVCLRFFVEFLTIFCCIYMYLQYMSKDCKSQLIYYFLNLGNSVVIIFLALYHSKSFSYLLVYIEKSNSRLSTDDIYNNNVNGKFTRVIIALVLVFVCSLLIVYAEYNIEYKFPNPYIYIAYAVGVTICNIRYILEYVVLYVLLFTISELTKSISRKFEKEQIVMALISINKHLIIDKNEMADTGFTENLKECNILYRNVKECIQLFNTTFGLLLTVMLATVTIYFVIVIYGITSTGLKMKVSVSYISLTCIKFVFFFVPLYNVSSMAQTAQNSVDSLRRHIAHRLITLPLDDKNIKATRKFLHLVQPIKIRASGTIDIDMALIPKIIMFFTTYAVTALQFNNVI